MSQYVYPNCVSTVAWKGGRIRLNPNQQWDADDPFVKARPEFFNVEPQNVARSGERPAPVERATRAPGERSTARRTTRAPKASSDQ